MRFKDKLAWTGGALFIYLICCQIPLYGVVRAAGADPFFWMRVILASNRGSLMELGISPLITSSMIIEFLVNSRVLKIDRKVREDAVLLKQAQKCTNPLPVALDSVCLGQSWDSSSHSHPPWATSTVEPMATWALLAMAMQC